MLLLIMICILFVAGILMIYLGNKEYQANNYEPYSVVSMIVGSGILMFSIICMILYILSK